jgi:hypothetical protein
VSDSDPIVRDPGIPEHLWRVHSNAAKRLWYEHRATGLKTYIKPMTAVVHGLPQGWQEMKNPDGRTYYFNAAKGTGSWTRPGGRLPVGWKESKTPDGVSFYVHDELQLCTWTKPGQQPATPAPVTTAAAPTAAAAAAASAGSTTLTSKRASFAKAAFSRENVGFTAKLASSAVEIGNDPIYGGTKMVVQSVRFAARKMKNSQKTKQILRKVGMNGAVNLASGAMNLAGGMGMGLDGDGADVDDDDDDDDNDDDDNDNDDDDGNDDDYDGDAGDQQSYAGLDDTSPMPQSPTSPTQYSNDEGGAIITGDNLY